MSAHAGFIDFAGSPVPPRTLAQLRTASRPYGPDGCVESCPAPGIVLLYCALAVTPEDRLDPQPVTLADGRLVTWAGRLDNRVDLAQELGLPSAQQWSDSQIVARAYERWGDETLRRLAGDWSLAVCDPRDRSVTLACDLLMVRPIYYVVTPTSCAWATALEGLVTLTGRGTDFDDDYLQAWLTNLRLPHRTAFREISMLPGGHVVRLSPHSAPAPRQFWHVPANTIRYRDRRDYAVHLRTVLRRAVADRLRTSTPVWMHLSGGWDSSTVVCLASRIAAEDGAGRLAALAYTTPDDPEGDESRFIDAVTAHTGVPTVKVPLAHAYAPTFPAPAHVRDVNPGLVHAYDGIRRDGGRVVLTGFVGDGTMMNFPIDLTSIVWAVREGRPVALLRALRDWSLASQRTAWQLAWMALTELLPERMEAARLQRDLLQRLGRGSGRRAFSDVYPMEGRALELMCAMQADYVRWCREEERPHVSRRFLRVLATGSLTGAFATPPETPGIVFTHPLADQRVVDYLLSLPAEIICEAGRPRALMRDACGPLLPDRVARRFSKGNAAPFAARRIGMLTPALSEARPTPFVVERGYVSAPLLAKKLHESRAGSTLAAQTLLSVGVLEAWLTQALSPARAA